MNSLVHSREALVPVPSDLEVIAELQALALAIRLVGLDNLDTVIVRPAHASRAVEGGK